MKAGYKMLVAACATLVMACAVVPGAQAQCGFSAKMVKPMGMAHACTGRASDVAIRRF
jgi:hypothetical protein